MKDGVICLGEALIDFIPTDQTNLIYEKCPGGAPANVAAGLSKLGVRTGFIGKVGDDILGHFLKKTLQNYGVDTSFMKMSREARTGLTFVSLGRNGERSFYFYINPSADQLLDQEELDEKCFQNKEILHIGSISFIHERSRKATQKAIRLSKDAGLLLSFDPNLRKDLWANEDQARDAITQVLPETDILKVSEEELAFITGEDEMNKGIDFLRDFQIPLIFITLGEKGSIVITGEAVNHVPAMKVHAVDTTAAGDAFVSGILYGLHCCEKDIRSLTQTEALKIARGANELGALTASRKGAMAALPTIKEVRNAFR